jgi:hypothetical protein
VGYTIARAEQHTNQSLSVHTLVADKTEFAQPGLWLPRTRVASVGIDERLVYAFDWDLAIRYFERFPGVTYTSANLAFYRYHSQSKTIAHRQSQIQEGRSIRARLARVLAQPADRAVCAEYLQREGWQRRLTAWSNNPNRNKIDVAMRMVFLALRRPRTRISRFWLGALRNTLFGERL